MTDLDRRTFLTLAGGAAFGAVWSRSAPSGITTADRGTLPRIGIQLYTVRRLGAVDLDGTLAQLAKIGYTEVEFAGYYNHAAADVRGMLDAHRLTAPSAHLDITRLEGAAAAKTYADAKVIGHEWLTVPSFPGRPTTVDDWQRAAQRLNAAAAQAKSAGFRFAYHNHDTELRPMAARVPLEVLLAETDPELVWFEMDIYWVINGGGNPLELIASHPGRFKMLHVKDSMGPPEHRMADVGAGTIDFRSILSRAARVEHYFVEHDKAADPMISAAASYHYLSNLNF